jgi:membrane protease YdiL (CAAX protease family)
MYIILPILLLLCWLAVYLSEKRNIFHQWLFPARRRVSEFFFGLILSIALCLLTQIFLTQLGGRTWHLSKSISLNKLTFSLLYDFNSVVSEELLFRGIILHFLIKYWKTGPAMLISASAFGIYHWITFGVWGNLMAIIVVFVVTGLMGYVFAAAYVKTKSIVLPVGIHLGWNWINNTVFSNGPNGIQVLEVDKTVPLEGLNAIISLILYLIIPFLILVFIKSKIIKERVLT